MTAIPLVQEFTLNDITLAAADLREILGAVTYFNGVPGPVLLLWARQGQIQVTDDGRVVTLDEYLNVLTKDQWRLAVATGACLLHDTWLCDEDVDIRLDPVFNALHIQVTDILTSDNPDSIQLLLRSATCINALFRDELGLQQAVIDAAPEGDFEEISEQAIAVYHQLLEQAGAFER